MSVWDWALLLVGLGTLLYWYMTRHYGYWRSVGVPTLPGALPGLGHMWDAFFLKASSPWLFCDFYRRTKGCPAIGLYSFRKPALLVRDLNLVQDVLIKEFSSFHDNVISVDESIDKHISRNPFILKGDRWKSLRQKINPAFSPARIKAMFPVFDSVFQEFNKYIETCFGEDIDVNLVTKLFTSEVVAKCAFGLDGGAFTSPDRGEFYQKGNKFWDSTLYNPLFMIIIEFFPIIKKILRISFVPQEVTTFFIEVIQQAEHYRTINPEKAPDDYLQYLLGLKKNDPDFTFDDVVAQSFTFFTDGFETTAVTTAFVIYQLTVHPEVQDSVRKEVLAMESFTYENILKLDLLDRVIKESLRKSGVFSVKKSCTKNHVLQADGESYPVRKGQQVIIPVYAIHNDPDIYPDPDKFDPDRFLPAVAKTRHPMAYMGFLGGPRICIGNRFATSLMKVFIANIVSKFRLLKCHKTVEKMKLAPQQIMAASVGGIWCRFEKL